MCALIACSSEPILDTTTGCMPKAEAPLPIDASHVWAIGGYTGCTCLCIRGGTSATCLFGTHFGGPFSNVQTGALNVVLLLLRLTGSDKSCPRQNCLPLPLRLFLRFRGWATTGRGFQLTQATSQQACSVLFHNMSLRVPTSASGVELGIGTSVAPLQPAPSFISPGAKLVTFSFSYRPGKKTCGSSAQLKEVGTNGKSCDAWPLKLNAPERIFSFFPVPVPGPTVSAPKNPGFIPARFRDCGPRPLAAPAYRARNETDKYGPT